jgi:hypothetical protein
MKKILIILSFAVVIIISVTSCDSGVADEITKTMNTTQDTIQGSVDFTNLVGGEDFYWNYTQAHNAWVSSPNPTVDLLIPSLINNTSYVTKYPHAYEFSADTVIYSYYYLKNTNSEEISSFEGGKGTFSYDASSKTLSISVVSNYTNTAAPGNTPVLESGTYSFKVLELTDTKLRLQISLLNVWSDLAAAVLTAYSNYAPDIAIVTMYYENTSY